MSIEFKKMVKDLCKSGADVLADLTPETAHLLHMAVGLSGEVSEFVDGVMEGDLVNCIEELGDIEFYLEGLYQALGIIPMGDNDVSRRVVRSDLLFDLVIKAGNILDLCKKISIYKDQKYYSTLPVLLVSFNTDLKSLYQELGISRDEALHVVRKKLAKRYEKGKYSNTAAKVRADKD